MDQLANLPEAVRKLALERFRIIQPHLGLIPTTVRKVSQDLYVTQISPFRLTIRNWLVSTGYSYNFRPFEPLPEHVISSIGSSAK